MCLSTSKESDRARVSPSPCDVPHKNNEPTQVNTLESSLDLSHVSKAITSPSTTVLERYPLSGEHQGTTDSYPEQNTRLCYGPITEHPSRTIRESLVKDTPISAAHKRWRAGKINPPKHQDLLSVSSGECLKRHCDAKHIRTSKSSFQNGLTESHHTNTRVNTPSYHKRSVTPCVLLASLSTSSQQSTKISYRNSIEHVRDKANVKQVQRNAVIPTPPTQVLGSTPHSLWQGLQRSELLLIVLESLNSLGYYTTQKTLESESGQSLYHESIQHLYGTVKRGDFSQAISILQTIPMTRTSFYWCEFLLYEQMYMECIYDKQMGNAVRILRENLKRAVQFHSLAKKRFVVLTSFLMLGNPQEIYREALWTLQGSREETWQQVKRFLPSKLCPPCHRLPHLLHQALQYQKLSCPSHEPHPLDILTTTLLTDHRCSMEPIPLESVVIFPTHKVDVTCTSVSPGGQYLESLASGSSDGQIILWKLDKSELQFQRHCAIQHGPILTLTWIGSDRYFAATILADGFQIWDAIKGKPWKFLINGKIEKNLKHLADFEYTSVTRWIKRKQQLIVSGDCTIMLFGVSFNSNHSNDLWISSSESSLDGVSLLRTDSQTSEMESCEDTTFYHSEHSVPEEKDTQNISLKLIQTWVFSKNVLDVDINYDATKLIICLGDRLIRIIVLSQNFQHLGTSCSPDIIMRETDLTTSLCASQLFDQFIVGVTEDPHVFHLWDIPTKRVTQRYVGHQQKFIMTSASFGGRHEAYVLAGSEDGKIFVWNRLYGNVMKILTGHTGIVTTISWIPGHKSFVSGSNEGQLLFWSTEVYAESDQPLKDISSANKSLDVSPLPP